MNASPRGIGPRKRSATRAARSCGTAALAACVLLGPGPAFAEAPTSLAVRLEGVAPEEAAPLRGALVKELPQTVEVMGDAAPRAGSAHLHVVMTAKTASVRYVGPDGRVLERVIDLPTDLVQRREILALLVANLVRDEASDLELALRGRPRPPASAEPVVPPPAAPERRPEASPPPVFEERTPCGKPFRLRPFVLEAVPGVAFPPWAEDRGATVLVHASFLGSYRGSVLGASGSILGGYKRGSLCGIDIAGVGTYVADSVIGAQMAGAVAAAGSLRGFQGAPVNLARKRLVGVQSGVLNLANDATGAQLGVLNIAMSMRGLQLGVANWQLSVLAEGEPRTHQLGVVNIAGSARFQVGVINVAETSDAPIGLVNVIRKGRTHLDALGSDHGIAFELVHGGRYAHAIHGVGVRNDDGPLPYFYLGLGGHIPIRNKGQRPLDAIDVDVLSHFFPGEGFRRNAQLEQLRVLANIPLFGPLTAIAGPTLNVTIAPNDTSRVSRFDDGFEDRGDSQTVRVGVGFAAGLRLF